MNEFRITLHMVSSLDGFITKTDNSVSWFETPDHYEKGVDPQTLAEFLGEIGCYVMGSRTYEHAYELAKSYGWVYGDKLTIVLTSWKLPFDRPNIEFYAGDLPTIVKHKLRPFYKNVWVVGGAAVIKDFIRQKLADEIRLSILPILLVMGCSFLIISERNKPCS